ncbi:signal peptidase I [Nakamurella sp. A5-74]|uniref:Signal peptidase I n=1 Tax=Nakamurella sp. A5-74 TaxID=3158264 RepID=A0AAU8DNT0_9ACTN
MNEPEATSCTDDGAILRGAVLRNGRCDTDAVKAPSEDDLSTSGSQDPEHEGAGSGDDAGTPTATAQRDRDEHGRAVASLRERNARRSGTGKKRPWWIEVPLLLITAFLLTFLIQTFLFKVYYVPSSSMDPTLHGALVGGDRIVANKIVYDFSDPKPGDVVVFRGPDRWAAEVIAIPGPTSILGKIGRTLGSVVGIAPAKEKDFVKRVIAVGGQTVECCDPQGRIKVDGVPIIEPYVAAGNEIPFTPGVDDCSRPLPSHRCFLPVKVPAGVLWVMGDNRRNSGDSTAGCQNNTPSSGCQGPVPIENVIGKAIVVILPVSRWHTLGDPGTDQRGG